MTLARATRLGHYEITGSLGAGGMGEVYRARDTRLGRDVALKVLPEAWAHDSDRRARLDREARLLAALNHPNVAAIHGVEESSGVPALVMELVEGSTLAERLSGGPLPVREAVAIARQVADALDAAHEAGIVHRDLKPANIKITTGGMVKVLDFGLAKALLGPEAEASASAAPTMTAAGTREGTVLGTAAYMSPEQARGQRVDKRTDIWAFGCVVYEMLAGRRPFGGPSSSDTLVSVLEREPDYGALPSIPPALARLIRRCLEKDAGLRLRDIGDARADLADLSDGSRTVAAPSSGGGRRAWRAAAVAALLSAALTLAAVRFSTPRNTQDGHPTFARVTRIAATPAHEFGPALSPDGKWVAYLSDARGPTDVWVQFIAGGDPINLTAASGLVIQSEDIVGGLDISPDGSQIAFTAGGSDTVPPTNATWVIPAPLGGVPRRVLDNPDQGLRWSPDGTQVAYVRGGGTAGDAVWLAKADGQDAREVVRAHGGLHMHWLRWSHDARHLYFNYGIQNLNGEKTAIHRVPTAGGAIEAVVPSVRRAVFPFPDMQGRGLVYAANPDTVDLALFWRDFRTGRDHRLTAGVGEYASPYLSADGRRLVATVTEARQMLARVGVAAAQAVLEPLADRLTGDSGPTWLKDGSRVVFSSVRSGARAIWSARPDLTGAVRLTSGPYLDIRPACSPDGRRVAFVSDRGGHPGVWTVSADGGAPRLLAAVEVLDTPSWSRDGRRLVATVATVNGPRLTFIAADTGARQPIDTPGSASAPAYSPTADVIAYLEPRPGEGTFLRFTSADGRPVAFDLPPQPTAFGNGILAWAPDGRRLAIAAVPGTSPGSMWLVEPQRAAAYRKLLGLPAGTYVRGLAWTPDGTALTVGVLSRSADIVLAENVD